jgi:4-hydroxybenzoate polyprenyltransferase
MAFLVSIRPNQWSKNLVVFAGLLFGEQLFDESSQFIAIAAFAVFCLGSSSMYLLNDLLDRLRDQEHPTKSKRPIAAGALSPRAAGIGALTLGTASLSAAFWLGNSFGFLTLTFLALLSSYSYTLKHIVILDVLTISLGFVLRASAGAVAIGVPISSWLLVCTLLLALFLGFTKRRCEMELLGNMSSRHRKSLIEYTPQLLDQFIVVTAAATIVSYAFYTGSAATVEKFETNLLVATLPFPIYGLFRYLYLVHQRDNSGNPSEMLLNDYSTLACVTLWVATVAFIIYRPLGL